MSKNSETPQLKKKPLFVGGFFMISCVAELGYILLVMLMLRNMAAQTNLWKPLAVIFMSLGLCLLFGLVEKLFGHFREIPFWVSFLGLYLVPLLLHGSLALYFWLEFKKAVKPGEDAEVFYYVFMTMGIYLAGAAVYRIIARVIHKFFF